MSTHWLKYIIRINQTNKIIPVHKSSSTTWLLLLLCIVLQTVLYLRFASTPHPTHSTVPPRKLKYTHFSFFERTQRFFLIIRLRLKLQPKENLLCLCGFKFDEMPEFQRMWLKKKNSAPRIPHCPLSWFSFDSIFQREDKSFQSFCWYKIWFLHVAFWTEKSNRVEISNKNREREMERRDAAGFWLRSGGECGLWADVDGSRNVTEELLNGIGQDPMPAPIKKASGSRSLALE